MLAYVVYIVKARFEKKKVYMIGEDSTKFVDPHLQSVDNSTRMSVVKDKKVDKKLFAIPAWLDMIESVLKNVAVTLIAASIV